MNPLTLATLRLLDDGTSRSGEAIAHALGVTRATVWNAIRDAERHGVEIEKVRGLGYRLATAPVWLDAERIASALGVRATDFRIDVLDSVASTNTLLLDGASAGAPSGTVIVTELQTGGRGRRGRRWSSGLGGGLTFSLLWRFEQGVAALSGLSLAVGIAVARALEARGARGIGVKWPNDLLFDGRKLGGILIEMQGDALGPAAAVIGIGLNVDASPAMRADVDQPVADVREAGGSVDRNLLLGTVLGALHEALTRFSAGGFGAFRTEFDRRHAYHGRSVTLALGDGSKVDGTVRGTAPDGALLVSTAGGERRFHGGEVSLRAAVCP